MKLKLDADGHAVLKDGLPVYVKDDNTEVAFDAPGATAAIGRLNAEAKTNRERAEAAEGKLKGFEGIEDPAKAREALGIVANLDAKKLVDAGEIERVKSEISKGFQTQIDAEKAAREKAEHGLYREMVGGAFVRSKFAGEKLAIPPDMVEAYFGRHFKIEDGQIVGHDANGQKLYSHSNPGALAGFDEALEMLVKSYPNKDAILKGSGGAGSGAGGGSGSGGNPQPKGNFGGDFAARKAAARAMRESSPTG